MRLKGLVGFFLAVTSVLAQERSDHPILRIDDGQHTAPIYSIGVDSQERFLVTGSLDKTVRIWELKTGRLLRVLRLPIGDGNDGKVSAVAISPDGQTVACGGWTGDGKDFSLYLFDRSSGQLLRRLNGFSGPVMSVKYSDGGRYLVVCLGGNGEIRLYRTGDYGQAAVDSYDSDIPYAADFDYSRRDGRIRLVTAARSGTLRVYEVVGSSLRLSTKRKAPLANTPRDVHFPPNGSKIAVGYGDAFRASVLRASNLASLCTVNTGSIAVFALAFSPDGNSLGGAGLGSAHTLHDWKPIISWSDGGCGQPKEFPAARDGIRSTRVLRDGSIVYASSSAEFGILDAKGRRTLDGGRKDLQGFVSPENFLAEISFLKGYTVSNGEHLDGSPERYYVTPKRSSPSFNASSMPVHSSPLRKLTSAIAVAEPTTRRRRITSSYRPLRASAMLKVSRPRWRMRVSVAPSTLTVES